MMRIKVNSEKLHSVGYDPDLKVLQIEFSGRKIYEYQKVDPLIYMGLMYTETKSAYFDKHIRDQYSFKLV